MSFKDVSKEVKTIGKYILGRTIGEGTFGLVKQGTHQLTGEVVAIKILEKEKIREQADLERVAREINILKQIRHPNIVQLYELVETDRSLYLIMEYAKGGELFDYISKNQRLKESEAAAFMLQILSGVQYLHGQRIMHRDLKPENLLLDENKQIKIADFGLSNTYHKDQLLKTACGSPCYAAPEMIAGKEYAPKQADIWSCGVVLYAMICGFLPFEDQQTPVLYKKILQGEYQVPKFMSPLAKDLLERVLTVDPQKRYTIEQIVQHNWMQTNLSNQQLTPGVVIGQDNIEVDIEVLQSLKNFNFKLDYAEQCILRNRHNEVTTTYYLLLKKRKNERKTPAEKAKDEKEERKSILHQMEQQQQGQQGQELKPGERDSVIATELPNVAQNQTQTASQLAKEKTEILDASMAKSEYKQEQRQEQRHDQRQEQQFQSHQQERSVKENLYTSQRQSQVEARETPHAHRVRNPSMSIEKRPETLFPTAQQIKEKALQFEYKAMENSERILHEKGLQGQTKAVENNERCFQQAKEKSLCSQGRTMENSEKSPQPKKQILAQRNAQNVTPSHTPQQSKRHYSPSIQIKDNEGPFNIQQLSYDEPAYVTKKVVKQLEPTYQFENVKKYDCTITKNDLVAKFQIQKLADGVSVVKCFRIAGKQEDFNQLYAILMTLK